MNYLLKGEGLHYLTLFELFMWVEGLHYLILFELFMCQANLMYNWHCGENVWTLILGNDIIRLSQFKVYWLSMLVKFCLVLLNLPKIIFCFVCSMYMTDYVKMFENKRIILRWVLLEYKQNIDNFCENVGFDF